MRYLWQAHRDFPLYAGPHKEEKSEREKKRISGREKEELPFAAAALREAHRRGETLPTLFKADFEGIFTGTPRKYGYLSKDLEPI